VLGLYLPGDSPLHRAPAWTKLAGLAAGLLVLSIRASPTTLAVASAVLVLATQAAGVGPRALAGQLRPALPVLAVVAAVQVWLGGWRPALTLAGTLAVGIAAAGLVTLTTRTADLLDAVVIAARPLRRFGVDPERIGLVLALAVRSVPVIAELAAQVNQARAARGAPRSVRAFAVPLLIRTVRHADRLGEALAARGVDD
jgi:biotin transport system permease protein